MGELVNRRYKKDILYGKNNSYFYELNNTTPRNLLSLDLYLNLRSSQICLQLQNRFLWASLSR